MNSGGTRYEMIIATGFNRNNNRSFYPEQNRHQPHNGRSVVGIANYLANSELNLKTLCRNQRFSLLSFMKKAENPRKKRGRI